MFNFNTKQDLKHSFSYQVGEGKWSWSRTLKFNKKWVALETRYFKVKDIKNILFYLFNNESSCIKSYRKNIPDAVENHLVSYYDSKICSKRYTPKEFKNEMMFHIGCHYFYLSELLLFMEEYSKIYEQ